MTAVAVAAVLLFQGIAELAFTAGLALIMAAVHSLDGKAFNNPVAMLLTPIGRALVIIGGRPCLA